MALSLWECSKADVQFQMFQKFVTVTVTFTAVLLSYNVHFKNYGTDLYYTFKNIIWSLKSQLIHLDKAAVERTLLQCS